MGTEKEEWEVKKSHIWTFPQPISSQVTNIHLNVANGFVPKRSKIWNALDFLNKNNYFIF